MNTSFRLRIMLMTVAVSGAVIIAFGLASRQLFWSLKLESIDQRLTRIPLRELPHPEQSWIWDRISDNLAGFGKRVVGGQLYLLSYGKDGERFFASESWPEDLNLEDLPQVEGELISIEEARHLRREERARGPGFLSKRFSDPPAPPEEGLLSLRGKGRPPLLDVLTLEADERELRVAVYQFSGYNMVIGVDLFELTDDVRRVQQAFFLALPFALAIVGVGAWLLSSGAIKPIRKLTRTAGAMSVRRLSERIEKAGEDREFAQLIEVFNGMLERLDKSFQQANRFSADAAHELKTPLTVIQGQLEAALQDSEEGSEDQTRFADLLSETQRLKAITQKLLLLAQADAGSLPVNRERFSLPELVEELVGDCEMESPQIVFSIQAADSLEVRSDRTLVMQIIRNLLSNAAKYNDEKGIVEVLLSVDGDIVLIDVMNSGEPVSDELSARLFERFTRGDASRNRRVGGFGLGLSLSKEFARALGGKLSYEGFVQGKNFFRFSLPRES
ncbi:MAG: HAMP domain-containing protein [Symploca sp. SIO2D2]|nr:HAMP domain-containing protein [Symploca sp. SIO2D2]